MARRAERKRVGTTLAVVLTVAVALLAVLIAWRALATRDAGDLALDLDAAPPLNVPDAPLAPRPQ